MHPFPPVGQISFLVGATIIQICIDPYGVSFVLDSNRVRMVLSSGGAFSYRAGDIDDTFAPGEGSRGQGPVRFHALLGQIVSTLMVAPEGDELTLTFDGGERLTIYSELGGYESGTISSDKGLWIF
jgi:hypothetical protein